MNTIKLVIKHLNPRLEIEGVSLTMYDSRALVSRQIAEEIRKFYGKKVYNTIIPRNVRVSEAPSHGVPVMLHDPKCAGARAYSELTKEFLAKGEKENGKQ
jgi:chromosome partitioning protein